MIKASFGLSETGAIRRENQDHYLLDTEHGILAVADGLGGLPNGEKASRIALDVLKNKLIHGTGRSLVDIVAEVNEETRAIGFQMDDSGFGTTLTFCRLLPDESALEIGHVGDSAAYLVRNGTVEAVTMEHTVAARMAEELFEDAADAIPLSAHHTLTQCIGQDLYIDPQVVKIPLVDGMRVFLLTDGVTKPVTPGVLNSYLLDRSSLDTIGQSLSFRIEASGSPDNYTIVAVEFAC